MRFPAFWVAPLSPCGLNTSQNGFLLEALLLSVEKMRAFLIKFCFYGVLFIMAFLALKYAVPFLMPFFLAFLIAFLLKPLIAWVTEKTKISRKTAAVLLLIAFYVLAGSLVTIIGSRIIVFCRNLFYALPRVYADVIEPTLGDMQQTLEYWVATLNPTLMDFVETAGESLASSLTSIVSAISSGALGVITNAASSLPSFLVKFFITIIASFFFTADYFQITSFLARQLPQGARDMLFTVKEKSVDILRSFLRAYAILMGLTFLEVFLGLTLLRVDYALLIALVTAVVDILPVLGTGTVMIPWGIAMLVTGNYPLGVGLLILYAVITVVRQMLEPRVVGHQIGLYPLVTLMCMFIGTYLFGAVGLFGVPILVTLLVHLNASGDIHLFK